MNKTALALLSLLLALFASAASAQVTVTKGVGDAVGVDVSGVTATGGPAAQAALRRPQERPLDGL